MNNPYGLWAFERIAKRIIAYAVLAPVLLVLFPIFRITEELIRVFDWLTWYR